MIYRFEAYCLDSERHELTCNGQANTVEPQVFSVLYQLLRHRDRVLPKEELMQLVWPGRVMSDAALSSRIKSARQAIGDDGKGQRLIKTVHGIGFRFIGQVQCFDHARSLDKIAQIPEPQADGRPSMLVLPFTCTSHQDQLAALPLGISQDIITALSRLRWLKVIARASAFQLTTAHMSFAEMRSATGVQYALSGWLEVHQRQLILNFELIDMRDETVLWADRISGSMDDVHAIRSDIVTRAVGVLELQISAKEAQAALLKTPENLDAWAAYHLGLTHLFRFTEGDNQAAVALLQRAVSLEPNFTRAHAGLSAAEFQNAFNQYQGVDRQTSVNAAIHSAERSIELDPLDPMANFVMGRSHWLQGDVQASLPWLERAIALNTNYAHGYYAHGLASLMSSQDLRGYQDANMAVSLSPLDPFLYGFYGIRAFSYVADKQFEQARQWAEKAACQPGAIVVMDMFAAVTCELVGDSVSAARWAQKARLRMPAINDQYFFKALPFAQGELREVMQQALNRL